VDLSDEAIILNFRQTKDPTHFKSLVRRYEGRVYAAVLRLVGNAEEAEEVVQDTFMKLHQNIDKFRSQASFAAWLFRIAHNCCMDRLRVKQRRKIYSFWSFDPQSAPDKEEQAESGKVISQLADPCPNPAEMLDASEQEQLIERCLKELPDQQRAVVILHDIEGFPYQDIAEITGATIGTVRSRLHYGRLKLRELLEPYFEQRDVAEASR
jgi:RNA polymerase sigma-70 factor (ECF subfamily)